jgi:HD-GYP domain-containing protein (c-di-GMP phosphodiesterase class II)
LKLTLLVENNPRIESFYKLNLTTWLGLETIIEPKAESAMQYIESHHEQVQLIIVRYKIQKELTAQILINFLKEKGLNIPFIVIGPGEVPDVPCVANSLDLKLLIKMAASALNITAKEMSSKVVPEYFPIPIQYFQSIKRSVCPVYFKGAGEGHNYHLKVDKLIDFDADFNASLLREGENFLYVDKMDRLDFVNNVTSELMSALEVEEISEDEMITALDKSIELLSKKLLTIGIKEETIVLAKKNIAIITANAKRSTKLSKLLDRLLSNKTSYLYKHTQILTYIGLHIIHNIDWGNADQEEKICFIAFFHDIALETDEQGKISSNSELKKSKLSEEKRILVEKHAQLAAEYVAKFPHAPMGSDQIIRQHHGQLHGLGFSDHYGANISPMAMVFIVAEEFTRLILEQDSLVLDRDALIEQMKTTFTTNRFQKIVQKLETITL